jgi:hypothetical protein
VSATAEDQTKEFRGWIGLVVIDQSTPYASGVRAVLPQAWIAVAKCRRVAYQRHGPEVRQPIPGELLSRRGNTRDPVRANRRLLLTGADHPPEASTGDSNKGRLRLPEHDQRRILTHIAVPPSPDRDERQLTGRCVYRRCRAGSSGRTGTAFQCPTPASGPAGTAADRSRDQSAVRRRPRQLVFVCTL